MKLPFYITLTALFIVIFLIYISILIVAKVSQVMDNNFYEGREK